MNSKDTSRHRISVCMATYNGAIFIRPQLESILKQLSQVDEIIISDDGSTDKTIEIILSFADSRIRLFNNSFHNHILNFEFALSKATGDIVFLSDQDDVWLDNKVEVMCKALESHNLVCSNCKIVDADLKIKNDSFYDESVNERLGFWRNLKHNHYLGCCLAFRRELLETVLPFPKGLITHDTWIGLNAELFGKPTFIDDKLLLYRRHGNNTSSTTEGSSLRFKEKISYRLIIVMGLINAFGKKVLKL